MTQTPDPLIRVKREVSPDSQTAAGSGDAVVVLQN